MPKVILIFHLIETKEKQIEFIYIFQVVVDFDVNVISGRLPARPIDRTGRLLHTAKKKLTEVKEIQTRAQFCVNISMYFIDKNIQLLHDYH